MRFLPVALGSVAIVASSVCSVRVAVAAAGTQCPRAGVLASLDGKTYAAVFTSARAYSGTVDATFYTAKQSYGASFSVTTGATAHGDTFTSPPLALVDPAPDPFEAAEFSFDGATPSGSCIDRERIDPPQKNDARVNAAVAGLDPAQPAIAFIRVIVDNSTTACLRPYEYARIDGQPAPLAYPAIARMTNASGVVSVRVALDASGNVTDATVYRSSGSPALDAAAVTSASHTRYLPEVFRCRPVPGAYDFRANFSAGPG
ncbi:MAG: energy transducer TonB [Candidatus Eremiobacteraeota bacterium]|nr:energy transducer TonB [Candidatus Eremiobacteraeota bacterium]